MSEYIWVTQEGVEIPIEEMQLTHILKALAYFTPKNSLKAKERVAALQKELYRRELDNL